MPRKSKNLPRHASVIREYAELERFARAFAAGHLQSLILIGPPGVGKSATFRNVLGGDVCWMAGNASPFGIYLNIFSHLNLPIVLDDIDDLHRHPQGVRLLKVLCQTDHVRTVSWHTRARDLEKLAVPNEFQTTSPVALIGNSWETLNVHVSAIEDRVHLLVFRPTHLEIHLQCSRWFWDQEIFDFVAAHLSLLAEHSLRLYIRASELKAANLDWRSAVLAQCFDGVTKVVAQLRADPSFISEESRVRAFIEGGHGCRATYFNHAKRAPVECSPPNLRLARSLPPKSKESSADLMQFLCGDSESADQV